MDRRFAYRSMQDKGTASIFVWGERWFVHNGAVVLDGERNAVRRAVRPVLRSVGLRSGGTITYGLESITADAMVLVMSDGTRLTWTRAPAD